MASKIEIYENLPHRTPLRFGALLLLLFSIYSTRNFNFRFCFLFRSHCARAVCCFHFSHSSCNFSTFMEKFNLRFHECLQFLGMKFCSTWTRIPSGQFLRCLFFIVPDLRWKPCNCEEKRKQHRANWHLISNSLRNVFRGCSCGCHRHFAALRVTHHFISNTAQYSSY